jgi:hypothetical protein
MICLKGKIMLRGLYALKSVRKSWEGTMVHHKEKRPDLRRPVDWKADPRLLSAVKDRAREGEMPCAAAFAIAEKIKVSPREVGFTADELGISLTKCQLGLFGYRPEKRVAKPAESVAPPLEGAIRSSVSNGRLPCQAAWEIAERLHLKKMEVASACEALKIKIGPCQLGAF